MGAGNAFTHPHEYGQLSACYVDYNPDCLELDELDGYQEMDEAYHTIIQTLEELGYEGHGTWYRDLSYQYHYAISDTVSLASTEMWTVLAAPGNGDDIVLYLVSNYEDGYCWTEKRNHRLALANHERSYDRILKALCKVLHVRRGHGWTSYQLTHESF